MIGRRILIFRRDLGVNREVVLQFRLVCTVLVSGDVKPALLQSPPLSAWDLASVFKFAVLSWLQALQPDLKKLQLLTKALYERDWLTVRILILLSNESMITDRLFILLL